MTRYGWLFSSLATFFLTVLLSYLAYGQRIDTLSTVVYSEKEMQVKMHKEIRDDLKIIRNDIKKILEKL